MMTRNFITLTAVLLSVLSCAMTTRAQTVECKQKLAELPAAAELFGFHLGMTAEEVKARVPQVVFGHTDEFGVTKTTINPGFDPHIDKKLFVDVRSISLDFLDQRLSSLWLGYESSYKWQTVPDFVAGISQSLHLPDAWEPWKSRGSRIRCADFQITVTTIAGGPSFRLIDDTAEQTIADRREARQQELTAAEQQSASEIVADKQTKVYYAAACASVAEVKAANRIVFKSKEEAERAGYKPAKNCQ